MSVCSVKHCKNNYVNAQKGGKEVHFHRFPTKPENTKNEWIERCVLPDGDEPTKKRRICSDHFLPEDYRNDGKRLRQEAVPSQLLPCK